ncbi:hypothetical protein Lal_00036668, partial [Lupinus albus]
ATFSQNLTVSRIHNWTPVTVLVDTRSSSNVIQPRLAHFLQLEISPTPQFSAMMGNVLWSNTPIVLQNQLFHITFYLLPVKGAYMVLGIEWLRTIGPVTSEFAIPSMSFKEGGTL